MNTGPQPPPTYWQVKPIHTMIFPGLSDSIIYTCAYMLDHFLCSVFQQNIARITYFQPKPNLCYVKHFFFYILDFINSMECYKYVNIRPPYTYAFLIRCVSTQVIEIKLIILFFLYAYLQHINIFWYFRLVTMSVLRFFITICISIFIYISVLFFL